MTLQFSRIEESKQDDDYVPTREDDKFESPINKQIVRGGGERAQPIQQQVDRVPRSLAKKSIIGLSTYEKEAETSSRANQRYMDELSSAKSLTGR